MSTMTKVLIHLPVSMKAKLEGLKAKGYTVSGYIRAVLEREFRSDPEFYKPKTTKKGT